MQTIKTYTEQDALDKGIYQVYFKVAILPELIGWLLEQIRPALNITASLTGSKNLTILSFETIQDGDETKLKAEIEISGDSPAVPVGAVLLVLGGLLIAVFVFLSFDRIEQIIDSPEGKAFGFGFLILVLAGTYFAFTIQKGKK